jgi:hypothetical protein
MGTILASHLMAPTRSGRARSSVPIRFHQLLANAWKRHQEQRIERAVLALDHQGVADDYRHAANRGR